MKYLSFLFVLFFVVACAPDEIIDGEIGDGWGGESPQPTIAGDPTENGDPQPTISEEPKDSTGNDCIDENAIQVDIACITLYDPVCGCDGNTYGNDCEAQAAGLKSWTPGQCDGSASGGGNDDVPQPTIAEEPKDPNKNSCIDESKITNIPCNYFTTPTPVCGCNGVTYPGSCDAENAGVTVWTEGECESNGSGGSIGGDNSIPPQPTIAEDPAGNF